MTPQSEPSIEASNELLRNELQKTQKAGLIDEKDLALFVSHVELKKINSFYINHKRYRAHGYRIPNFLRQEAQDVLYDKKDASRDFCHAGYDFEFGITASYHAIAVTNEISHNEEVVCFIKADNIIVDIGPYAVLEYIDNHIHYDEDSLDKITAKLVRTIKFKRMLEGLVAEYDE
jgi:hypothetical protein